MTAAAIAREPAPRRMLRRREAALYCGCKVDTFDRDWRPYLPSVSKALTASTRRTELVFDMRDLDALIEKRKQPAPVDR